LLFVKNKKGCDNMKTLDTVLQEIEELKQVNKHFKISKNTKRIKFAVIDGNKSTGYSFKVLEGDYLVTKKYGKVHGQGGDSYYKVRVSEDNIQNVDRDGVIEVIK